jgi:hypothetical protein
MRMTLMMVAGLFALVNGPAAWLSVLPQREAAKSESQLDPRIPAANRLAYRAVRDSRDWRNPYLLGSDKGLELRSMSSPDSRVVPLTDLRRTLTELPVTDWPYGRVVAVQSPSIVPADSAWNEALKRNIDGAREILKALGAADWGWPA